MTDVEEIKTTKPETEPVAEGEQKQRGSGSGSRGGRNTESRGGSRGGQGKTNNVKYVKKGQEGEEGGAGEDKKYNDRKGGQRNYRRNDDDQDNEGFKNRRNYEGDRKRGKRREQKDSKYDWNRDNVTLETAIPEIPKKNKETKQPDQDALDKKLIDLENQIEEIHQRKRKYVDELVKTNKKQKQEKDEKVLPTRTLLKGKQDLKKDQRDEFQKHQKNFQTIKSQIEELFDKSNKLRNKMKILKKKDQIEQELEEKRNTLHNAILSQQEEKRIINQIEALEKSLPHSVPLASVEDKIDQLQKEKKNAQKYMNEAYKVLKTTEDEIKELQNDMNEIKNFKEENRNSLEPLIAEKKSEYATQIDDLKAKKKVAKDEYEKQREEWEDQQEFIRHVEWMKRIKDKLVKEERRKKKDEELKKKNEEEEKLEKERLAEINPYQEQLELCEMLINYIQLKITPKVEEKVEEIDRSQILKDHEGTLQKEKLEYLESRKERKEEENNGKRAQKKKKNQQKINQKDENQNQSINHQVEVLGYFDSVKVPAPLFKDDFPKTLEQLKEKKAYYEQCAQEHKDGTDKKEDAVEGEKEAETNEEGEESNRKESADQTNKKQHKPKKAQKSVNVDDEEEFPTMG